MMADVINRAESARDNIIPLPARPRSMRRDVPPFDPSNPVHIAAWEALWDAGQSALAQRGQ